MSGLMRGNRATGRDGDTEVDAIAWPDGSFTIAEVRRDVATVSGEVMEDGWWHPAACVNTHDEGDNCLDADGSIAGWRERRLVPVSEPKEFSQGPSWEELGLSVDPVPAFLKRRAGE